MTRTVSEFDLLGTLPTGTTVLEASAGTGKTYALVGLATRFVAEGTADDIRNSDAPYVHQFVWGEADGPVAFHYPSRAYGEEIHAVAGHA